jgi:acetoin utilization protein AcuB
MMYVKDWMTLDPIVVSPDTPILDAQKLMRDRKVRRLPVVDKGKLVGIVTYRDVMEASPSEATSLSIHEINYLLSKLTVKEVMATDLVVVGPNDTAEHAALLGAEKGVGALPVVHKGKLVGIATETDIFRFYLALLGAREELRRITLEDVDVQRGTLKEISGVVEEAGGTVLSIFSVPQKASDLRFVMIRAKSSHEGPLTKALKEKGYKIHR